MQIYIWVQKCVSYTIYNTDLGANSIQNPIKYFFCYRLIASACRGLPRGLGGGGRKGGAIVLANINQSHINVFNRVLNGISSRSGNNITHALTHTHARTHSSSTAEKRRRALIQQGREVSQPPWKPERQSGGVRGGSKADSLHTHTHTGSSRDETFTFKKRRYLTQQNKTEWFRVLAQKKTKPYSFQVVLKK